MPDNDQSFSQDTILRRSPDFLQLVYPTDEGQVYVLQFAEGECNVVFKQGGSLVWEFLSLIDGHRSVREILTSLQEHYEGPDILWNEHIPDLLNDFIAWRVVVSIPDDQKSSEDAS